MTLLQAKDLTEEQILAIHGYYESLKPMSLTKSATWATKQYNIECTRHHLSAMFKRRGLYVQPPNGRDYTTIQEKEFYDGVSRFAGKMIESTWNDIRNYVQGKKGDLLDFITACWFVSSPEYAMYLDALNAGLREMEPIAIDTLPPGITEQDIMQGRSLYLKQYNYWVCKE